MTKLKQSWILAVLRMTSGVVSVSVVVLLAVVVFKEMVSAPSAIRKIASESVDELIDQLNSDDPLARYHGAWKLGELGNARAIDPLVESLDDEDWHVRQAAIWSLGQIGDPRAIEPLKALLRNNDYPELRWYITTALGAIYQNHPSAAETAPSPITRAISPMAGLSGLYDYFFEHEIEAEMIHKILRVSRTHPQRMNPQTKAQVFESAQGFVQWNAYQTLFQTPCFTRVFDNFRGWRLGSTGGQGLFQSDDEYAREAQRVFRIFLERECGVKGHFSPD